MFCKNCGKEIDDNSDFCNFCGSNLKEENFQKRKKNKKPVIVIVILVLIIGLIIGGIVIINIKKNNEQMEREYHDLLIKTGAKLYVSEMATEAHAAYITKVWYNAIFEKRDAYTDEYIYIDKYGTGFKFNVTFSEAIENYLTKNKTQISKLKEYKNEIQEDMIKLQQTPNSEYSSALNSIQNMYAKFNTLLDLLSSPTGAYKDYAEKWHGYSEDFKSEYDKLIVLIPEISQENIEKEKEELILK